MTERYEIASPEVLSEDFGGEIVALNLENGRYYSLRGLGHALWQDVCAGHSPEAIRKALAEVDVGLAAESVSFVATLQAERLIRLRAVGIVPSGPPSSIKAVQDGSGKPLLESFDDMADLIKTDPIHEVDEKFGWPVRLEQ